MSNPEQIRADIESTRDELGRDVDALADKVSPPKIMERQKTRVRQRFDGVKERFMGVAGDMGHSASSMGHTAGGALSDAGEAVKDLPNKARQTTQGAPLVVGLVAAGLGFLAASLIPTSDAERRLGSQLREQAQPLVDKAKDTAQEMAQNLKEPAQDAMAQVKDAATSSAQTVKEEAQHTAERVKGNVAPGSGSEGSGSGGTQQV
jgi:gas vesicle protein